MISDDVFVGAVFPTNNYGDVTVMKVEAWDKITVEFASGCVKVVTAGQLRLGSIKDLFWPSVFGVGYIGVGEFKSKVGGKDTLEYNTWRNMLERCFSTNFHKVNPTYVGCTVAKEWHNFQNFAAWYTKQDGYEERWQIDKDLITPGNKTYSLSTCALIPREVNSLLISSGRCRGEQPIGVSWCKTHKTFVATVNRGQGRRERIGYFHTAQLAFDAYKSAKEAYIKVVAEKYKDVLPHTIYNNLMTYTVEITD